ncbi:hypothetical protein NEIELOOT_02014 [Neisseria elongata subsp. glycolytica ATCC 29315]|uniref:Uncharacterized protein n=1 Tax=Neisseria elongata subsp. glycolytica ATCC 29315 TaxID=546263 RepID=D4DSG9_NEIEG|nr:hypothetical protein NEIELOOT_02014 [Neisseria elongata subsp. glycolytica ATCC 29315]
MVRRKTGGRQYRQHDKGRLKIVRTAFMLSDGLQILPQPFQFSPCTGFQLRLTQHTRGMGDGEYGQVVEGRGDGFGVFRLFEKLAEQQDGADAAGSRFVAHPFGGGLQSGGIGGKIPPTAASWCGGSRRRSGRWRQACCRAIRRPHR